MRTSLLLAAVALIAVPMLGTGAAHAQATRTWVSGVGDDANPCSRTAPCKTFAGAISKTAVGGEINCLDPGGYGAVTITKSMTIDCEDTQGSILAASTTGVIVNITAATDGAKRVLLRGISINGAGTGLNGVNFIAGNSLALDQMIIQNFNVSSANGLLFQPNTANSTLQVHNSVFLSNGIAPSTGGGIVIQPAAGGNAVAVISNSVVENNSDGIRANSTSGAVTLTVRDTTVGNNRGNGVSALAGNANTVMIDRATISNNFQTGVVSSGGNATVRIMASSVGGNSTGASSVAGGVLRSYKNNAINGNGTDGTPIAQENLN